MFRGLSIRSRILLGSLLIAITPLLVMYFYQAKMLESTGFLIIKDAGDYAHRKTRLVESTVRADVNAALQNNAHMAGRSFAHFQASKNGNTLAALDSLLTILDHEANQVYIFDEQGRLLHRLNDQQLPKQLQTYTEITAALHEADFLVAEETLQPTQLKLVLASNALADFSWMKTAHHFRDDFTNDVRAKLNQTNYLMAMSATILLMLLALVAYFLSQRLAGSLTNPIQQLIEAVDKFDGIHPVKITAERRDKIGLLTESFAAMTQKLTVMRQELAVKQESLEKADVEMMQLNLNLEHRIEERTKNLKDALGRLRELDKNKDDFLGLISHELKTPLTSISASAEGLLSEDLNLSEEGRRRFLAIIRDEADRLGRLINDLLDMTRLEANRMPINNKSVDLAELVAHDAHAHRAAIERKGLKLVVEISEDPALHDVLLDPDRMTQVMANLISNAIKFTERGRITIRLELALIARKKYVRLTVADTGIGIRPGDAPKVFDRFQQIERFDMHHEGWGLGMPISKMLVERMGGEIRFASKPKHGTAFTVTLPLAGPEDEADQPTY